MKLFDLVLFSLITSIFFIINVLTIDWFPEVWMDEVSYIDPAINLYLGNGFTSSSWANQASTSFWASNSPLHQILLYIWVNLFGVSIVSVRLINFFFVGASVYILLSALIQSKLINKSFPKIAIITLFYCGAGISYIYRCGRPDGITILLAIVSIYPFLVYSSQKKINYTLFIIGVFFPIAGIQLVAYSVILYLILAPFYFKKIFLNAVFHGAGMALGFIIMFGFFAYKGVLYDFLVNTLASGHTITGNIAQKIVIANETANEKLLNRFLEFLAGYKLYVLDISYTFLLSYIIIETVVQYLSNKKIPRLHLLGLLVSVLVPPLILVVGKYKIYYSWMGFIPVVLFSQIVLNKRMISTPKSILTYLGISLVLISSLVGLPNHLYRGFSSNNQDFKRMADFVEDNLSKNDDVYADHLVYYSAKKKVNSIYFITYAGGKNLPQIPDDEKRSINKILVKKADVEKSKNRIGGEWKTLDEVRLKTGDIIQLLERK